jgi:hypothetical protein
MYQFKTFSSSGYSWRLIAVFGLMSLFAAGTVWACSTPVYRYAMYRWEAAPYEIYYFHEDAVDDAAAALHTAIRDAAKSEEQPVNLFLATVDVKADPELKTVPPDVRKWWQAQEEKKTPSYLVVTPYGQPIHHGELDETVFKTMIDSPARQAMVKQLSEGHAGVMVLVTGSDDKANSEAEKLIQEFVADIASGKIELYIPPPQGFFAPPREGEEEEKPQVPKIEVGFVKVDRSDEKEKWLVESLLSMEEDLKNDEFTDKPMMFMVFGRGRALPPCVGKGVNRDNLLDCVDFVTGACSCTVKDQNPGMDLMFATDWYKAAEKMATKFGAEEGNEYQLATEDFFPDLVIPAVQPGTAGAEVMAQETGTQTAPEATAEPAGEAEAVSATSDSAAERPAAASAAPNDPPAADPPAESASESADETPIEVAARSLPAAAEAGGSSPASTVEPRGIFAGVFMVGAGVAVAFVLLFGMTFFVLRPR